LPAPVGIVTAADVGGGPAHLVPSAGSGRPGAIFSFTNHFNWTKNYPFDLRSFRLFPGNGKAAPMQAPGVELRRGGSTGETPCGRKFLPRAPGHRPAAVRIQFIEGADLWQRR
jgi:hypothetical protein